MRKFVRAKNLVPIIAVFLLAALVVVLTQVRNGAFVAELGDDEASHYLSGLMIRDYLSSGFVMSPVAYVKWYFSHYPLIGIGHWGPVFYGLEALWMLVFGVSRTSVILLSTVLATTTAALIFAYGMRYLRLSVWTALFAAMAFVLCPITQAGSSSVMLDIPITLCALLALWAYTRYMETERTTDSLLFGVAASAALLIKGNGLLLALLPPFALLFSGKWYLLARRSFWAPAVLVAILTGPWTLFTYDQVAAGFRYAWGAEYVWVSLTRNSAILLDALGPAIWALVGFGLLAGFRGIPDMPRVGYRTLLALFAATVVFQLFVPAAIQDRYLAPALVPLFLTAAVGAEYLAAMARRWTPTPRVTAPVFAALALLAIGPAAVSTPPKIKMGFRELALDVWRNRTGHNPVVLIAARNMGEGAAIAERAMTDPARPSIIALRASRLLGAGGYNRQDLYAKYSDITEVQRQIEQVRVPLVWHQADPGGWQHVAQVDATRENAEVPWQLVGTARGTQSPVNLYRVPAAADLPADLPFVMDLTAPNALRGRPPG